MSPVSFLYYGSNVLPHKTIIALGENPKIEAKCYNFQVSKESEGGGWRERKKGIWSDGERESSLAGVAFRYTMHSGTGGLYIA